MPDNQRLDEVRRRRLGDLVGMVLLVLFAPLILVVNVYSVAQWLALRIALLIAWAPRGRRVLFVYSDSPVWGDYIRNRMLPRLPPSAVVLNWSQRSTWRRMSLAVWVFHSYAGTSEFNPLGVIVPPLGRARVYRFWTPFRDYRHGKPEKLAALETRFLDDLPPA